MNSKICTVVVTYNRLELLKNAINALRKQSLASDILVINNGSTDGTDKYLKEQDDLLVIHQENVGGAGGFYTGMKFAAEKGYDFAWVMDDDVLPDVNALKELKDAYDFLILKEKVGFLCSKVVDIKNEPVNLPNIEQKRSYNGYGCWSKYLHEGIVGVSSATFVSVFLSCKIIFELGLPIKEFFIWGDDTEYTNRISSKYSSYLVGKSIVTHLRNGGAIDLITLKDKNRIKMYRFSVRNNIYLNRQSYFSKKEKVINYLWYLILITRLLKNGAFNKILLIIKSVFEGLKFNPSISYPDKN